MDKELRKKIAKELAYQNEIGHSKEAIWAKCIKHGWADEYLEKADKLLALIEPPVEDVIEDGFGSAWSAWCPMCHQKTMVVVRPGKVQCNNCG